MALTQFLPMDSYYHGILAATEMVVHRFLKIFKAGYFDKVHALCCQRTITLSGDYLEMEGLPGARLYAGI